MNGIDGNGFYERRHVGARGAASARLGRVEGAGA